MAVQTLHQMTEPPRPGLTEDDAGSYADEVQMLRERVAALEAALATAEANKANQVDVARETPPLTSIDFAPPVQNQAVGSEFAEPATPAVVAVAPAPAAAPTGAADLEPAGQASPTDAWVDDEVSFEERVAAKAFFHASTVDQQSRNWLLDQ